jgi:hypothetical protein
MPLRLPRVADVRGVRHGAKERATGMITEIYVSRPDLPSFMAEAASHVPARRFEI